jgi:hypothetical protein
MPRVLGTGVPATNNLDLKSYGIELNIGWNDRLKNGLGYGVKLNLWDAQTEITRYPNPQNTIGYGPGWKMGEFWGYSILGIAKTQDEMDAYRATLKEGQMATHQAGDLMIRDINGDGIIGGGANTYEDHGDNIRLGNNTPRYSFGLDLTADYKGFDLRAFFQGVLKRDVALGSNNFYGTAFGSILYTSVFKSHLDFFRDDPNDPLGLNLDSYYGRPYYSSAVTRNQMTCDRFVQNASYVRLKNLQMGYTLPKAFTSKFAVSNMRIYLSGENLLTFTKLFKEFDPEGVDGASQLWGSGGLGYPIMKVVSLGCSITF